MIGTLAKRLLLEPDKRLVAVFLKNFLWRGARAMKRHRQRVSRGEYFPPFVFFSITDACNLSCKGCWVTQSQPARELDPKAVNAAIAQCKQMGAYFFGLLGGEPLLHSGLRDIIEFNADCYFQVFTNGTLLTPEHASAMRRLGNVTPLVSIEGLEAESDRRRGGSGVFRSAMDALALCRENRLITGVATSVCKGNFADVVSMDFVTDMARRGAHYLWYYIYRPVGEHPDVDMALDEEEILNLRRFLVTARTSAPIVIVDAYWDHDGRPLCPAAEGLSYHVGPGGDIEPCPPIQFARENMGDGTDFARLVTESAFLADFRKTARQIGGGCVLLDDPALLVKLVRRHGAVDSSGRSSALSELDSMTPRPSHALPGREIPETHWFYRLAKKNSFFGLAAYG